MSVAVMESPLSTAGAMELGASGSVAGTRLPAGGLPADGVHVSEARLLMTLMDNTPERIYFKDLQSRFMQGNRALAAFFGVRHPDELIGKTDADFFSAEHARAALDDEQRVIKTGHPLVNREEKETWPDGTTTWSSTSKARLLDEAGRPVGSFGISRDITERRQAQLALQASEERYRQLLAAIPTYTYCVQMEGKRPISTQHSMGCLAITGYTPAEYAAKPGLWLEMVHPEDRTAVADHVRRVLSFERVKPLEHRINHRDGTVRWVRNTIVHHRDAEGRVLRYDGLVEDITERKHAEVVLQTTLEELDERVRMRTAELAQANEVLQVEVAERKRTETKMQDVVSRLRALDEARLRLVSNVSHELKTPLTSLRFAIDNMIKGVAGPLSDVCRAYLAMMKRDTDRLMRTVLEILDLSRIETHTLALNTSRVRLADLVRETVESLKIHADAKQQQLAVQWGDRDDITVEWDVEKIERVVINVVENAIKYTPKGGRVYVRVRPDDTHAGVVVLDVVDNGIGIAPQHIDHVTDRYFRVGEQVSGAGLGLSITQEIVKRHGGWLKVASPPHGEACGTQVSLYIPMVPRHESAAAAPRAAG